MFFMEGFARFLLVISHKLSFEMMIDIQDKLTKFTNTIGRDYQ